ncbi:hypothetical protein [Amycolatopsis sp. CA-230715]|uniref:hypothetical protein n=1 Tax=Amycolatopsis sp. CA-230715 TaxID=2745196 RepID=UPI001C028AD5|nr:hypothetical protein [Amycolatopsis sp. CA-230715]QWF85660.1 hypothetical protein HUW46_09115 [Amycolatopsis sp. CA-230715]
MRKPVRVADTTRDDAAPGFARRNAWVLAGVVLLAAIAFAATIIWAGQRTALEEQRHQIEVADGRITLAERRTSERVDTDVLTSLGLNRARIDRDTALIGSLVRTAFTWDSGTTYDQARTTLQHRFGLRDDGEFLTRFMPASRYNEDATGTRYYYLDSEGVNSTVVASPDVDVVNAAAGEYSYLVRADIQITSDAPRQHASRPLVAADRTVLLHVTIDAQKRVSRLTGIPASGPTRHSR